MQEVDACIEYNLSKDVAGKTKSKTYFSSDRRNFFSYKAYKHNGENGDAEGRIYLLHKGVEGIA